MEHLKEMCAKFGVVRGLTRGCDEKVREKPTISALLLGMKTMRSLQKIQINSSLPEYHC